MGAVRRSSSDVCSLAAVFQHILMQCAMVDADSVFAPADAMRRGTR